MQEFDPVIRTGNRVSATDHLTIRVAQLVETGHDALLASYVFISDNQHGRSDVEQPFKYQPLEKISPVRVGRDCWIGEHVVIMLGVTIGKFSIIGTNSVVTESVPPRSIAAGSPARIVRKWDSSANEWVSPK